MITEIPNPLWPAMGRMVPAIPAAGSVVDANS